MTKVKDRLQNGDKLTLAGRLHYFYWHCANAASFRPAFKMPVEAGSRTSVETNTKSNMTVSFLSHLQQQQSDRRKQTLPLSEAAAAAAGSSPDDGLFTLPPSSSCWRKSRTSQGPASLKKRCLRLGHADKTLRRSPFPFIT